jgi:hypothetical protein
MEGEHRLAGKGGGLITRKYTFSWRKPIYAGGNPGGLRELSLAGKWDPKQELGLFHYFLKNDFLRANMRSTMMGWCTLYDHEGF